jgi:ppGpp synthetase/RelA/SpoT-type nucleotidyltranferase
MAEESESTPKFDFNAHREFAIAEYEKIRPIYQKFAEDARKIISDTLDDHIRYHSIEARAKKIKDFGKKAAKPSEEDPAKPKYPNPLKNITDMAGVRVITFLPKNVEDVCKIIEHEFTVLEKVDKAAKSINEGKIGYQSVHYLVEMNQSRKDLPEYRQYNDLILEIQVRTILQHAWAEMEHDIQYKSVIEIPTLIKRRFIALAGLLDIADREFQTLQEEYEQKKQEKEKELENYLSALDTLRSATLQDSDYILESLKEIDLWINSEKYEEVLSKRLDRIVEEQKNLIQQIYENLDKIKQKTEKSIDRDNEKQDLKDQKQ